MDPQAIYQKTEKGREEFARRSHGLPARERSLLILVDGRRNRAQLLEAANHFGDAERCLTHLFEGGFIEPVTGAPPAAATSPDKDSGAAPKHLQNPWG